MGKSFAGLIDLAWKFANALANRQQQRSDDGREEVGDDWAVYESRANESAGRLIDPFLGRTKGFAAAQDGLEAVLRESPSSGQSLLQRTIDAKVVDRLGEEVVQMMAIAQNRWMLLIKMVPQTHCPRAALEFLWRVSRCYLFGFDAECVVFCRSALEAALKDVGGDSTRKLALHDRIKAAERSGTITPELRQLSVTLKDWGNECVHGNTQMKMPDGSDIDPRVAVLIVMELLKHLYPDS